MSYKIEIYGRFASCYCASRPSELAEILGIDRQVLNHWKSGARPIPWTRLRKLINEQNLNWDWLIEGKEPKHRCDAQKISRKSFDRKGINRRFLSLFPSYSNAKLGKELGVSGATVFKWRHNLEQVAWERLKHAVATKGVTWEWLIEGR